MWAVERLAKPRHYLSIDRHSNTVKLVKKAKDTGTCPFDQMGPMTVIKEQRIFTHSGYSTSREIVY